MNTTQTKDPVKSGRLGGLIDLTEHYVLRTRLEPMFQPLSSCPDDGKSRKIVYDDANGKDGRYPLSPGCMAILTEQGEQAGYPIKRAYVTVSGPHVLHVQFTNSYPEYRFCAGNMGIGEADDA